MQEIVTLEGDLTPPSDARIGIVAARFNGLIVDSLLAGCVDALSRHGVAAADLTVVWVPGAFELPLAVKRLATSGAYRGICALGAVIRGATPHFEHVAGSCTRGLAQIALETGVPIGFGVLTVDTIEQALERAGTKAGNKGADAALAVIEMISLLRKLP
jgi:6,7-dimethyl-8-ribityllumazine synthase